MKRILMIVASVGFSAHAAKTAMSPAEVLSRLHDTNQEEIAIGKLARESGRSERVKMFGDRLVRDHTDADQQVEALAKDEGVKLAKPVPKTAQEAAMMSKHALLLAKLKTLNGAQFDDAFVKGMKEGHNDVIRQLENADISDAKTKKLVRRILPELKHHRDIASRLESKTNQEIKEAR